MQALLLIALLAVASANIPLTTGWHPNAYGVCTSAIVNASQSPPYTNGNLDALIGEGVGYSPSGNTCGFKAAGSPFAEMPQIYRDLWMAAASQDYYNGKHVNLSTWKTDDCSTGNITYQQATTGDMCGKMCGVCVLVTGPQGAGVFMINEIADYDAVGQNGEGINLHLLNQAPQYSSVRSNGGARKDIQFKTVPCPVTGPVYITIRGNYGATSVYYSLFGYRYGLSSVYIKRSTDADWLPLARGWTNTWIWETYGCATCVQYQNGWGSLNSNFSMKLTSQTGQNITCEGLSWTSTSNPAVDSVTACSDSNGNPVQFPIDTNYNDLTPCSGTIGATTYVNSAYYATPTPTPGVTPTPTPGVTPTPTPTPGVTPTPTPGPGPTPGSSSSSSVEASILLALSVISLLL